jgi:type II secretory ATPase GspE/PulE/Tfp pilus assembly ATPase PilB-like protein
MIFVPALRSTIDQAPDFILSEEIRDEETAETTLRVARAGHLVLRTVNKKDIINGITPL